MRFSSLPLLFDDKSGVTQLVQIHHFFRVFLFVVYRCFQHDGQMLEFFVNEEFGQRFAADFPFADFS